MDNDLMARRLRPPSEPAARPATSPAPFILPEYESDQALAAAPAWPPAVPAWPPAPPPAEDLAPPPMADIAPQWEAVADETPAAAHDDAVALDDEVRASEEGSAAFEPPAGTPAPYEAPPGNPQARDEVPWDRPSDYQQPTDTATADQLSWDRPEPGFWADPDALDNPLAEMDEPGAGVDLAEPPPWFQATSGQATSDQAAAVASTPRADEASASQVAASDPDDAYAPVLGDIAMPAARGWPAVNGHDASRNDATLAADAFAQAQGTTTAPAPAESIEALADARAGSDEPTDSAQSWPDPGSAHTSWTPGPDALPHEWETSAVDGPDDLAAEADFVSEPERQPEAGASAEPQPGDATEYQLEPATEYQLEPMTDAEFEPVAEPEPAPPPTAAPESVASTPHQPLVVRLELSIVDDSIHITGPADAVWRVNDANAVVLDVGESVLAEAERLTPRHPAFEPRAQNGDEHQAASAWLEPSLPRPTAEASIPPATPNPPWLQDTALTHPEAQADPWARAADPAPWPGASATAQPPGVAVQEQSDLWFLATEPANIDDATESGVALVKESSMKMALWTIGFAILVLLLVLVFIHLMTSLLR